MANEVDLWGVTDDEVSDCPTYEKIEPITDLLF
jgi:hypothetical protein